MTKKDRKSKGLAKGGIPPLPENVSRSAVLNIWELYHLARKGRMDIAKASRLVYMLTSMVKAHELADLERRIRELEERQSRRAS